MKSQIDQYLKEHNIDEKFMYTHKDSNMYENKNRIRFTYDYEKIKDFNYIAQYFTNHDLVIFWNQKDHLRTNCYSASFSKACEAANSNIKYFWKGVDHPKKKQTKVYACHSSDVETVLNLICKGVNK